MNLIQEDIRGKDIWVVDTETTSLNTNAAEILQLAALKYSDDIGEWELRNWYFKPRGHISSKTTEITGLTKDILDEQSDGLYFDEQYMELEHIFKHNSILVGHNFKNYDSKVIMSNYRKIGVKCPLVAGNLDKRVYDTLLSIKDFPCYAGKNVSRAKLGVLYENTLKHCGMSQEVIENHPDRILRALGCSDFELRAHNAAYDVCINALALYMARKKIKQLEK